jgi:hypothetical protein
MRRVSRRGFGRLAIDGLSAALGGRPPALRPHPGIGGIRPGVPTVLFAHLPLARMLRELATLGVGACELWQGHLEPAALVRAWRQDGEAGARDRLRRWRLSVPIEHAEAIRDRLRAVGIEVQAYRMHLDAAISPDEFDRLLDLARATGAGVLFAETCDVPMTLVMRALERQMPLAVDRAVAAALQALEVGRAGDSLTPFRQLGIALTIRGTAEDAREALAMLDAEGERIQLLRLRIPPGDLGRGSMRAVPRPELLQVLRLVRNREPRLPLIVEPDVQEPPSPASIFASVEYCRFLLAALS